MLGSHLHLGSPASWLLDHVDVILEAVARSDLHVLDPTPGRDHFYRQHVEPNRWL